MIPKSNESIILENFKIAKYPNYTYKMLIEDERIIGDTDSIEAIEQACYKILNTERYAFVIYSWNYGVELADLFGKPMPYVYAEAPRRITEALMHDDRIKQVNNFRLSHKKNDFTAIFDVVTVAGVLELSKGVKIL